jgi:hypothetical protein
VTQQQKRRRIRPVAVLEHEQQRAPASRAGKQVADDRVQPVSLRVRIGRDRLGEPLDPGGQLRQQASELSAGGAEVLAQRVCVASAHELLERLHEGAVGRPHDGVARTVENDHPAGGRLA